MRRCSNETPRQNLVGERGSHTSSAAAQGARFAAVEIKPWLQSKLGYGSVRNRRKTDVQFNSPRQRTFGPLDSFGPLIARKSVFQIESYIAESRALKNPLRKSVFPVVSLHVQESDATGRPAIGPGRHAGALRTGAEPRHTETACVARGLAGGGLRCLTFPWILQGKRVC